MGQLADRVSVITEGKGPAGILTRAKSLPIRYGLGPNKLNTALEQLARILDEVGGKASLPVTGVTLARHPNGKIRR